MVRVFDLDGTLLDSNGIWRAIDERFVRRRGRVLTDEYNEYVSHAIFPDAARFTKRYYHLEESEEEIMAAWHSMAYRAYASELVMKPGAQAFLMRCKDAGERTVLYTSSEPSLCRAALEHHGIEGCFERLLFAQELKLEKKHSTSFTTLSAMLDAEPGACILYDDSPVACASAKKAGWHVVGVYDPFFASHRDTMLRQCDEYITGFEQLMEK